MEILALTMALIVLIGAITIIGHRAAVEQSEAALREKNLHHETLKLLREAGYNV